MNENIIHGARIISTALDWQKLAKFLGYELVGCSQDGDSHSATMLRPDGTHAEFTLPERDLRRLCEGLRQPLQPPRTRAPFSR